MTYAQPERIAARHETEGFDCGSQAQTTWLRRHALQADRTDSTRVMVVTRQGEQRVVGFHALSAGSVEPAIAPRRVAAGLPRYPVPVVLLTRLGVDLAEQGRGLGRALVKDALLRAAAAAETVAARALVVHCESDEAKAFYLRLAEFEPSPTDPLHRYLLMSDLRRSLGD